MSANARQGEPDGAGARPLADDEIQRVLLQRRVKNLLDDPVHPVDLVDEEDVALLEIREDRSHVPRPLQDGTGGTLEPHAQFVRDQGGQRRLPQAGRAVEEDVIERLPPLARGVDRKGEVLLHAHLPHELLEPQGPERDVEAGVVVEPFGGSLDETPPLLL
jgi:hypothetical protein